MADKLDVLIHRADLDGLVRMVDSLCAAHQWEELFQLRERARHAVASGRQLWPAATLAEYRLALWAPSRWAAMVLDEGSGRFTIGPLTEVVAQHHLFDELAAHLDGGPRLGFIAHEAALRGQTIAHPPLNPLDIPFDVQPWEPAYPLATYSDDGVDAPAPAVEAVFRPLVSTGSAVPCDDPLVEAAVRQLLEAWTTSSNGRAECACVEGTADDAVAALGVGSGHIGELTPSGALAWLAWAGASGGAHGRRRGMAGGRFGAWWLLAALADAVDEWPIPAADMGLVANDLKWYWWTSGEPALGWQLRLAVEDQAEGLAWAISADDAT